MGERTRPTFLGIGAQRAGTTWLHRAFVRHPQVWVPPLKELHYFTRGERYKASRRMTVGSPWRRLIGSGTWERPATIDRLRRSWKDVRRGNWPNARWWLHIALGRYSDEWYLDCFRPGRDVLHRGEITPAYAILEDDDVRRIKAMNPDIRLILLVRDPVERAWSGLCRKIASGEVHLDVEDEEVLLAAVDRGPIHARGDYERTLETYLRHFDASQILVGFHDATFADPEGLLAAVAEFLGLQPFTDSREVLVKRPRPSFTFRMPDRVRAFLCERYAPAIDRMAESLGGYATRWGHLGDGAGDSTPDGAGNGAVPVPARHP